MLSPQGIFVLLVVVALGDELPAICEQGVDSSSLLQKPIASLVKSQPPLVVPDEVPQDLALLNSTKVTTAEFPIDTIALLRNHPACDAMFPDLELRLGAFGDRCLTAHWYENRQKNTFWCPDGCTGLSPQRGGNLRCVEISSGEFCGYTNSHKGTINVGMGDGSWDRCTKRSPFTTINRLNFGWDYDFGVYCSGPSSEFIAPKGCLYRLSYLHYHRMGTLNQEGTGPCRIRGEGTPAVGAVAGWKLIASNTHGLQASIEVGMASATSKEITKEETHAFGVSVTTGVGVEGSAFGVDISASIEVSASYDYSQAVAHSLADTLERVTLSTVTVDCPDWSDTSQTSVRYQPNPDTSRMEYIWQYQVTDGGLTAQTEHFRCHHSISGSRQPQCPPELCGDPSTNPYCEVQYSEDCKKVLSYHS